MQYCFLQHQTFLPSPVTSTTVCSFCFGSISSFFLELFFHLSPVAFLAPTNLGSSSFSVLSFCLFKLFSGLSKQEYWCSLQFPSPVDHILSELSSMTCPSWVTLHGIAHPYIELDKAVVHLIRLIIFLWLWFSFFLPSDGKGQEAYGSFLMGNTDWGGNWVLFWWVGLCSVNFSSNFLLFDLRPNYGGGNEGGPSTGPVRALLHAMPQPCNRPPPTHASAGDAWTLLGKSGSISFGVTAPFSWVLVHKILLVPPRACFPVLCRFWRLHGGLVVTSPGGLMPHPGLMHPETLSLQ